MELWKNWFMIAILVFLWTTIRVRGNRLVSSDRNQLLNEFKLLQSEPEDDLSLGFDLKAEIAVLQRENGYRPPFPGTLRSSSQEIAEPLKKPSRKASSSFLTPAEEEGGSGSSIRRTIQCVCDTPECQDNSQPTCHTSGHCYTQLLDTEDGTPPITKGCIPGETPLLCENRRPNTARHWPYLICCNTNLCNAAAAGPKAATKMNTGNNVIEATETLTTAHKTNGHIPSENPLSLDQSSLEEPLTETNEKIHDLLPSQHGTHDSIRIKSHPAVNFNHSDSVVSPLASSFLIGGAVVIVVISVVGFYILRRERSRPPTFYERDFEETGEDPLPNRHDPLRTQARDEAGEPLRRKVDGIENETCLDESQRRLKSESKGSEEPESKC